MKNQNKYTNLANGLAFYALNNSSIIFTLIALYGLVSIRYFAIVDQKPKYKSLSETLMIFVTLRFIFEVLGMMQTSTYISHTVIIINAITFIISLFIIFYGLTYLKEILNLYDLKHLSKKIESSALIVIAADGILVLLLLLVLFVSVFNIQFLYNFLSIFLNPTTNFTIGLIFIMVKYFASRNFTKAAMMLRQIDHDITID